MPKKLPMKLLAFLVFNLFIASLSIAQTLYFPPFPGDEWETVDIVDLNWNLEAIDELNSFLEEGNTKAFLVLVDGKIAIEEYFGTFTLDSFWYWASAGKSLTAFLTGVAQAEDHLIVDHPVSDYLGVGWTSLDEEKEVLISVKNLLTMTSGLDYNVPDPNCTLDSCFQFLDDPGSFWYYYNAPYTMLSYVLEEATGQGINGLLFSRLSMRTGITGLYLNIGFNRVVFSNARSFARFGLLCLAKGIWDGTDVLGDPDYFQEMISSSQTYNLSYGYLWWLNGKESFMVPQSTNVFQGNYAPEAPDDMYSAIGRDGQILMVIPSKNMVIVRMGDNPDNVLVPFFLINDIWERMNRVLPVTTLLDDKGDPGLTFFPNPSGDYVNVEIPDFDGKFKFEIIDLNGRVVSAGYSCRSVSLKGLPAGSFFLRIYLGEAVFQSKLMKY
ncbi:MAG: T9SS C-terminal target domain-containing protein [Saprospirales bacterium]|nr:MAG: T9SS C-terminal target domain-containing protein [Saprospirales bacterium]